EDAVPGGGHQGEVLSCAAGRIQDHGGRWAGAQQPGHPVLLRRGGIAMVVVGGGVLVIAGENCGTPLLQPGLPVLAASLGGGAAAIARCRCLARSARGAPPRPGARGRGACAVVSACGGPGSRPSPALHAGPGGAVPPSGPAPRRTRLVGASGSP